MHHSVSHAEQNYWISMALKAQGGGKNPENSLLSKRVDLMGIYSKEMSESLSLM